MLKCAEKGCESLGQIKVAYIATNFSVPFRHGSCVPFSANESETVCGRFYETGVDTIYVPDGRSLNTLNRLVAEASSGLSVVRDECV